VHVAHVTHAHIEFPVRGTSFLHRIYDFEQQKPLQFPSHTKQPQQAFGVLLKQKETPKRTLKREKKVRTGNNGLKEAPRQWWF
jgi:hypothetical protein